MIQGTLNKNKTLPTISHHQDHLKAKELKAPSNNDKNNSGQESFEPHPNQSKKYGKRTKKTIYSTGSWSSSQNLIYYYFMRDNYKDFIDQTNRRKCKVFNRLSKILKRRTPDQCRSHHQKLQLKFSDNLPVIMNQVNKKIQKSYAQEFVNSQYQHQKIHMNHMQYLPGGYVPEIKIFAQEQWYSISLNGNKTKVQIEASQIKEW